jgi:hypothetical protein
VETEFIIGPLFLTAGDSTFDLIIGLLLGNLLAVLSWRYLTFKIAVKKEIDLYIIKLKKNVVKSWYCINHYKCDRTDMLYNLN